MRRIRMLALGLLVLLSPFGESARAQWSYGYPYGYGGYGWRGWGGTLQGDVARGLGYFNMGAGVYNRQTAVARSINTDTAMRWNEYVYRSQLEANRKYLARRHRTNATDKKAYDDLMHRIQDAPSDMDIEDGDALNAALDQLSDPRIHTSALRAAEAPVAAKVIREIPFRNASEGVAISLGQLKAASEWPAVLLEKRFDTDRVEFEKLVEELQNEDLEQADLSPQKLGRLREVVARIKSTLSAHPLDGKTENQEAIRFLKTVTALTRMLEKPDIAQAMTELEKMESTSLGNLLAFMHTFNLRFGPATTAHQREVYHDLYAIVDRTRDRLLEEFKLDESKAGPENKAKISDFFSSMDYDHIEGKKKAPDQPKSEQP